MVSTAENRAHVQVFHIEREEDVSGVSGIGVVAVGVIWPSGEVEIEWIVPGKPESRTKYENLDEVIQIHGHEGRTKVVIGNYGKKCRACGRAYRTQKLKKENEGVDVK